MKKIVLCLLVFMTQFFIQFAIADPASRGICMHQCVQHNGCVALNYDINNPSCAEGGCCSTCCWSWCNEAPGHYYSWCVPEQKITFMDNPFKGCTGKQLTVTYFLPNSTKTGTKTFRECTAKDASRKGK